MKLKPFEEILKLSKEAVDALMAPIRANKVKAKANLKVAEIEEQKATLEAAIHEMCASKNVDFDNVVDKMDEYDLLVRRQTQFGDIVKQLFGDK
jgi:hypothetical protein